MGYFGDAYEARDMSLSTMTEGISVEGMRDFTDTLKTKLLTGICDQLKQTGTISSAIKEGWQGQSRDIFLERFEKSIKDIERDLNAEYEDLMRKLGELMDSYFNQDKKMVAMLNDF